jgi:hypothetical protein
MPTTFWEVSLALSNILQSSSGISHGSALLLLLALKRAELGALTGEPFTDRIGDVLEVIATWWVWKRGRESL